MTVRVTTLKGADAGAYYVEQLPNYYLQSGEPRGVWFGDGADQLGLAGEVVDDDFLAVMAGMDPQRPDRHLGRRYDDQSVRGFDVTASAPKSVSVLFALGSPHVRGAVLSAHDAAVDAMAGWIERHAHTRYRIGGEVAVVDAEGIVAAAFRQHTSRALDPQLHTHLVIANRVKSPDGRWLALDARLIKHDQQTLSAIYHAGLRAELTRRLGVRWHEPDHGIAEIVDVPEQLLAEFSTRTTDVRRRTDAKLDRFVETMDREPTPRERWRLERGAAIESRPPKTHAVNAEALHATWAAVTRAIGLDPMDVVADASGRVANRHRLDHPAVVGLIDRAMDAIAEKQSSWRPTELTRELAAAVPTDLAAPAAALVPWLETTTEFAVENRCVDISRPVMPSAFVRRDGRPVSESIVDRALTTSAILNEEDELIAWADRRLAYDGVGHPDAVMRSDHELHAAQAEAACAVAGTADLVLVVGPAGTGKTTALTPGVEQLWVDGRRVFGVAPSANAADVLANETGLVTDTLDKLLIEHRLPRGPRPQFDLPVGTTVIVDEAGMVPTAKLAELAELADVRGWRIALVGDPLQFSAVGRGGMFGLLVDTFGAIELERVHRFEHEWERPASLRLRSGDVTVVDDYDAHGRLCGGTVDQMERAAVARWATCRAEGKTVALMAPTNEAVERLNQRCQRDRVRRGELDDSNGLPAGPYTLHVGDEIATRQNDRRLVTDRGEIVRNRSTWTIHEILPDGSIAVTGRNGRIDLPAAYVAEHVELAYARTAMGAQGSTVDVGIVLIDKPTDVRNLYVAMTRGRESNEALVVTTGEQTAADVLAHCITTDWIDRPALARRAELRGEPIHRPGLLDPDRLREAIEERHTMRTTLDQARSTIRAADVTIADAKSAVSASRAQVAECIDALTSAADILARYDRPLHRRRHAPAIARAQRAVQSIPGAIEQSRTAVRVDELHLDEVSERVTAARAVVANADRYEAAISRLEDLLFCDHRVRTHVTRPEQSQVVVEMIDPDRPGRQGRVGVDMEA